MRVLVHRGFFNTPGSPQYFFIKVANLSRDRDIEVTHIWFDTDPQVEVLNPDRPLHARVRPAQTFETWKPTAEVPDAPDVEKLVRVRISNGNIVKSRLNEDVRPEGHVAGPGNS